MPRPKKKAKSERQRDREGKGSALKTNGLKENTKTTFQNHILSLIQSLILEDSVFFLQHLTCRVLLVFALFLLSDISTEDLSGWILF